MCEFFLINLLGISVVYNPHLPLRENKGDPKNPHQKILLISALMWTGVVSGCHVRMPRRSMEMEVISLQRAQFKDALKINVKT